MAADISPELAKARSFNDSEENRLYGPDPNVDEHGEPIEPASPWLGFQALGIATALVGLSAGLGIFGAAKFLGVSSVSATLSLSQVLGGSSGMELERERERGGGKCRGTRRADTQMEEFAHKMRGGLEGTYPEFIAQVRREGDEAPPETPTLLTRHGELDEPKFDDWIRSIEIEEAAEAEIARRAALAGGSDAPVSALPAAQGLSDSTQSPLLAAVTQREQWAERVASSDRRLV